MPDDENLPKGNLIRKRRELPVKDRFGQIFMYEEEGEDFDDVVMPRYQNIPFDPRFPPPPFIEYEEEIELDEDELEEDELEALLEEGFYIDESDEDDEEEIEEITIQEDMKQRLQERILSRQGRSLIADEGVALLQQENLKEARQTEAKEMSKSHRESILTVFLSILCISLFVGGLGFGILYYKGYIFKEASPVASMSEAEADEYLHWKLEDSPLNNLFKGFYKETSSFGLMANARGEYVKGSLRKEGKEYSYWFMKNREGNTYLKLEAEAEEYAYFFPEYTLGRRLLETKISGQSEVLEPLEGELLRAVFLYDEYFWNIAFPNQSLFFGLRNAEFKLLGTEKIDGKTYEKLELILPNKNMYFYFNVHTKLLSFIKYKHDGNDFEVKFSEYRRFSDGLKMPLSREIYLNSDLKIELKSTLITRKNEKLSFPY